MFFVCGYIVGHFYGLQSAACQNSDGASHGNGIDDIRQVRARNFHRLYDFDSAQRQLDIGQIRSRNREVEGNKYIP